MNKHPEVMDQLEAWLESVPGLELNPGWRDSTWTRYYNKDTTEKDEL